MTATKGAVPENPWAKCDNGRHEGCIHRRSPIVKIEVQLWPPPPLDARPYWCYIDTLIFYDKKNREAWRQRIPSPFKSEVARRVVKHDTFGWVLHYELTHKEARGVLWVVGQRDPPNVEDS